MSPNRIANLRVKIFADGADKTTIHDLSLNPLICGFTTNPTLMRQAGVPDYRAFAVDILQVVAGRPVSFEVISDDFREMERQAREIASWGEQVYVKIPVCNTRGEPTYSLIRTLATAGVKLNVTAVMTLDQVGEVVDSLTGGSSCFVSVFAGRIADTGRDPVPIMASALEVLRPHSNAELIWASTRELLNIFQADAIGCHAITVTSDILKKLPLVGKDLHQYSQETVRTFYDDAMRSNFAVPVNEMVLS